MAGPADDIARKNKKTMRVTLWVVAVMLGLSFAAVPLYRITCQVTGWGGTTQEVRTNPFEGKTIAKAATRQFTVRFSSSVAKGMPWIFKPETRAVTLRAGQDGIASYLATNTAATPVTGTAVYNVVPLQAGRYFYKTQCFCFSEQTLKPGETAHMPVVFFVDPAILDDPEMRNVTTITLSYTFFRHDTQDLENATKKFYTEADYPTPVNAQASADGKAAR